MTRIRFTNVLARYPPMLVDDQRVRNEVQSQRDTYGGETIRIAKTVSGCLPGTAEYLVVHRFTTMPRKLSTGKLLIARYSPTTVNASHHKVSEHYEDISIAPADAAPVDIPNDRQYDLTLDRLFQTPPEELTELVNVLKYCKDSLGTVKVADFGDMTEPMIFDASECYASDNLPNHYTLSGNCMQHISPVFRYGHLHEASRSPEEHAHLYLHLSVKKPSDARAVVNAKTDYFGMRAPARIKTKQTISESAWTECSAVVSTNFWLTDLHIDHGWQGLSGSIGDCVKLWLLWPPTPSNLDIFYTVNGQEGKLTRIAHKLQGGVQALTTSQDVIWLPAGWLHAVYTLRGGILIGINWVAGGDEEISADIFERECKAGLISTSDIAGKIRPVVDSLMTDFEGIDTRARAQRTWCKRSGMLRKALEDAKSPVLQGLIEKASENKEETCPECNGLFIDHLPRIRQRKKR